MKNYTQSKLQQVLNEHKLWLEDQNKGKRADLSKADLSRADLSKADLSWANLLWANLSRADLSRANLSWANLFGANLSGANLSRADLSKADLSRANLLKADLYGTDLSGANLSWANLSGANLSEANLLKADLYGTDLSRANLSGANLSWANLYGANLSGTDLSMFNILSEGTLIVYKKLQNNLIATLEIGKNVKRINAYGSRKCRAEQAKVLKIEDLNGHKYKEGFGLYEEKFKYIVGKIVNPNRYDEDPRIECSNGIHFFITKEEARNYND